MYLILLVITLQCFLLANPLEKNTILTTILNKRIQKQRSFQEGHTVKHSKDSEMLVKLLQISDSKRYNIPSTQILLGLYDYI